MHHHVHLYLILIQTPEVYIMFQLIYLNKDHKGRGHDLVKQLDLGASDGKHSLKVSSVNQHYLSIQTFLFPAG